MNANPHKENLEVLVGMKACDTDTANILDVNDDFVSSVVKYVVEILEADRGRVERAEWQEVLYEEGRKLLFLEEFVQQDKEVQAQVKEWLSDEKRRALFNLSSLGDLYGNLLIAKASGSLDDFRQEYNKGIPPQPVYVFDQNVVISLEGDISEDTRLIEQKLDAVISRARQEALRNPKLVNVKKLIEETPFFDEFAEDDESNIDALDKARVVTPFEARFAKITRGILELYEQAHVYLSQDIDIVSSAKKLLQTYEGPIIDARIKSIRNTVLNQRETITQMNSLDKLLESIGLYIDSHLGNELLNLQQMYGEIQSGKGLSSKLKNAKILTYTLELSDKDPLDVRFGNDSGCCLRINKDEINNAYGLPHSIADNATYIFNIYQQIGSRKKTRVGIVLAFDTVDENGNRILACNSLELSPLMNPFRAVAPVVEFVEKGLEDFGIKHNYDAVVMSSHDFNTSQNCSSKKDASFQYEFLRKVRNPSEPEFYSEMSFDEDGKIINEKEKEVFMVGTVLKVKNFYVLYDNRK